MINRINNSTNLNIYEFDYIILYHTSYNMLYYNYSVSLLAVYSLSGSLLFTVNLFTDCDDALILFFNIVILVFFEWIFIKNICKKCNILCVLSSWIYIKKILTLGSKRNTKRVFVKHWREWQKCWPLSVFSLHPSNHLDQPSNCRGTWKAISQHQNIVVT